MNNTKTITWIPLSKQKPRPNKGHNGSYLVTLPDGRIEIDRWFQNDFNMSAARDPKTGGRNYDAFVIAWAEMPRGYVET